MRIRGMRAGWLLVVLLLGGWDLFKSPNPDVERGNQAFRDGKYDEALGAYDKAARGDSKVAGEPGLRFNRGAALYQKAMNTPPGPARDQLLTQAQGEFAQSSQAPDRTLRGAAHYNMGNTHYQKGDYDKAVSEYKQSIKEDPSNPDARYNLELALRRREEKKQQQQQQQQGNGQKKDQKDQQQGQQDQQQQQQGQPQDQKDQQQQQGQQDQKDQQQQQGQQDQKDQQQQQQKDQQGQPQDQKDQQQQKDQQGQPQDQKDQKDSPGQDSPDQKDAQNPQDQKDQKDQQKDQKGDAKKPAAPPRKTFGDEENKMDALERRSKDLKVQQQRGRGNARRGKVKDW